MRDKVFVDTNIFIYAYSDDDILKHQKARKLFQKDLANSSITVSVQVLNEFYSVMSKSKLSHQKITQQINEIVEQTFVKAISMKTISQCLKVKEKYNYVIHLLSSSVGEC